MTKTTSTQPRKQRKRMYTAPLHTRHRMVGAALSKELKEKYRKNSIPVRKGDTVKLMRGEMKGHSGEVMKVDLKRYRIYVQGVTAKKADGTDVEKPVAPSNVMITAFNEEDKERREIISRNVEAE
jgi:large subunit ribosomal protein L24